MSVIEFPGLWGLSFNINSVAFFIFGIPIYWYGIIISTGFLLAVLLGLKDSRRFEMDPDNIIDLVLYATPVAIIAARLYYVAFAWDEFKDDPLKIFNTRTGGLAIYGAIIGALLTAYIFARKKKIGFLKLFDFGVPYLAMAQSIGRWGNFVNQEAFGTNTNLPWGMTGNHIKQDLLRRMDSLKAQGIIVDPNIPVHPTFLYESIWDLCIFLFLIWYRKRKKLDGEIFYLYMSLYGIGRFFIEGLRTDSLMLGNLRISSVLAFIFAVTFAAIFFYKRRKASEEDNTEVEIGPRPYAAVLKKLTDENEEYGEEDEKDITDISSNTDFEQQNEDLSGAEESYSENGEDKAGQ